MSPNLLFKPSCGGKSEEKKNEKQDMRKAEPPLEDRQKRTKPEKKKDKMKRKDVAKKEDKSVKLPRSSSSSRLGTAFTHIIWDNFFLRLGYNAAKIKDVLCIY